MFGFLCGLCATGTVYLALDIALEKANFSHQKVGGIRFFKLGRLRLSFCIAKKAKAPKGARASANPALHVQSAA